MIRHLLQAWAFKLAFPAWLCASMRIDSGLIFYDDVPAEWIAQITPLYADVSFLAHLKESGHGETAGASPGEHEAPIKLKPQEP